MIIIDKKKYLEQNHIPIDYSLIEFMTIENKNFVKNWNIFLKNYEIYTFCYDYEYLEYQNYIGNNKVKNLSFILLFNNFPIAIIPLFLCNDKKKKYMGFPKGEYLPSFLKYKNLTEKQNKKIDSIVSKKIFEIFNGFKIEYMKFYGNYLSFASSDINDLFPSKIGSHEFLYYDNFVDLQDADLWSQIRDSYKSIINKGMKFYNFEIYDHTNYTKAIGELHAKMHHECAGRITRPIESFNKSYEWIKNKKAIMFVQKDNNLIVQMILVAITKSTSIGISSADNINYTVDIPLTHSMNYFIYKFLKKIGIKYHEVGDVTYENLNIFDNVDKKGNDIRAFKRGFGNIKYPNKKYIYLQNSEIKNNISSILNKELS